MFSGLPGAAPVRGQAYLEDKVSLLPLCFEAFPAKVILFCSTDTGFSSRLPSRTRPLLAPSCPRPPPPGPPPPSSPLQGTRQRHLNSSSNRCDNNGPFLSFPNSNCISHRLAAAAPSVLVLPSSPAGRPGQGRCQAQGPAGQGAGERVDR